MSLMRFCPKCGKITNVNKEQCLFCGYQMNETQYTFKEYLNNTVDIKQKIKEEYIDNSPEFDEELAKKREKENEKVLRSTESCVSTQSKNIPKCPTCGSTNVNKISTTKKATGFLAVGVFSSNLGKTMECKNCGYKW